MKSWSHTVFNRIQLIYFCLSDSTSGFFGLFFFPKILGCSCYRKRKMYWGGLISLTPISSGDIMFIHLQMKTVTMQMKTDIVFIHLQMKTNAALEWQPVVFTLHVKIPQGITSAFAPRVSAVKIPARKTARIQTSVRRKYAKRTPSVKTPLEALFASVRKDLEAMAVKPALTSMNARFLLTR